MQAHGDYVYFNPAQHGLVRRAAEMMRCRTMPISCGAMRFAY